MKSRSRSKCRQGVLVVGSGTRFISGVSHYTRYIATALAEQTPVSVILMRRLIPRALYPGRDRVGAHLTDAAYPAGMPVYDGVDWYWIPSIFGALRALHRQRPQALLLEWWTGAVLHSYLLLALVARLQGARVVIEIHELQDTGEATMGAARRYVERFGRALMRMADAYVVHSDFDRDALQESFATGDRPIRVVRHGPYSHYSVDHAEPLRDAPADACNLLFFGTIRPYKGLEDLVEAFEVLAGDEQGRKFWLTVVGETWEDWTKPVEMIQRSKHQDRITLVNRYVTDADAARWFAGADIVVLPYRRSSASGPLHMAMYAGLPVIITDVGGLGEASGDYAGTVLVPPADPDALRESIRDAVAMSGQRFNDEGSWDAGARAILEILAEVDPRH
jgi:glycosyltransferase involved in cell wall biosynthesis